MLRQHVPIVFLGALLLSVLRSTPSCASESDQLPFKKILDLQGYKRWTSIVAPALSADGRWVAYTELAANGDGVMVVESTRNSHRVFRIPRGRVANVGAYLHSRSPLPGLDSARFAAGSRFVLFATSGADGRERELIILSLPDGAVERVPHIVDFTLPGGCVCYVGYVTGDSYIADRGASVRIEHSIDEHRKSAGETEQPSVPTHRSISVRDLRSGREVKIASVGEYKFDGAGGYLIYTKATSDATSGVYSLRLSDGNVSTILAGVGKYHNLTLNHDGTKLAFLADRAESDSKHFSEDSLYYASSLAHEAQLAVQAAELTQGWVIAANAPMSFVQTGAAILFGLTPRELSAEVPPREVTRLLDHWREAQPLANAVSSPAPTCGGVYAAAYQIEQHRWLQLENAATPLVLVSADGRRAVGLGLHMLRRTWDVPTVDVTLIDLLSGARHLVRRNLQPHSQNFVLSSTLDPRRCLGAQILLSLSPGGRYALYFEQQRWWSLDLERETIVDLTGSLLSTESFDDAPTQAQASQRLVTTVALRTGIAGWTTGDRRVVLYGERDIWEVDPTGRVPPKNLTRGIGRQENTTLRLLDLDGARLLERPNASVGQGPIDTSESHLLLGVDQDTMATSVWRLAARGALPQKIVSFDRKLVPIAKASKVGDYLFTRESFDEFPDLWVGSQIDHLKRLTDANPQQREYRWGTSELIKFSSDFGAPLNAILYKPEGFDPRRKYPMVVAIYEEASHGLHDYLNPQALAGGLYAAPWPSLVSRGYLLLVPDIQSTAPYPGQSAAAAVEALVRAVISRGYVDAQRMALSGHSFGAYEAIYILSQTSLFHCAIIGSGYSDTTSFSQEHPARYMDSAFVERSQLRHGGSVWEHPFVYLVNSPLFAADRITTPPLIIHNNLDVPVPFTSGLQLFRSLRRNSQQAYLLNYPGEDHRLTQMNDRIDWDERAFQFLDYYLKDGARPEWMDASTSPMQSITVDQR